MNRSLTLLAAGLGFLGVAAGALGAHGVKAMLEGAPDAAARLGWWETGARYHLPHALAIAACAVLARHVEGRTPKVAAGFFAAGIALFSGSLYVMALTGLRMPAAAITPIGGLLFLAGWSVFALAALKLPR